MSHPGLIVIGVAGIAAYEVVTHIPHSDAGAGGSTTGGGASQNTGITVGQPFVNHNPSLGGAQYTFGGGSGRSSTGTPIQVDATKTELQKKLEAAAKAEFDKLSCDAKKEGLAKLKKDYPTVPIADSDACTITWQQAMAALSGIAGGAAGAALCGAVCGAIGAVVSAYLGSQLTDWIQQDPANGSLLVLVPAGLGIGVVVALKEGWDYVSSWF